MPLDGDTLSLLQAQMEHKKQLIHVLEELHIQEKGLLERTALLKKSMIQEEKDVQRLEGHSLAAFFLQVTGKMDASLAKERREAYAARVKYDAAMRELQALQEDIQETSQDLQDLQHCEIRYQEALEKARQAVKESPDPQGGLLLDQEQHLQSLAQQKQELESAITAGTAALRTMADIQQNLHSAKDWATHENRGPAFWADRARQEKLDVAQKNGEQLQIQLQRFNAELTDIAIRPKLRASIQQMLLFSDRFFTTLTSDMSVLERIWESCTLADQTRDLILGVLRQLQNALEEVRHTLSLTRQEIDHIILGSISQSKETRP